MMGTVNANTSDPYCSSRPGSVHGIPLLLEFV